MGVEVTRCQAGRKNGCAIAYHPQPAACAGQSFQLDCEEARTGTLLAEHVIGIE